MKVINVFISARLSVSLGGVLGVRTAVQGQEGIIIGLRVVAFHRSLGEKIKIPSII